MTEQDSNTSKMNGEVRNIIDISRIQRLFNRVIDTTKTKIAFFTLLGAVLILAPFVADPYALHLLIAIFFYATLASSWDIVSGYTGQFSFAHASLAAMGAYLFGLIAINLGFPVPVSFLISIGLTTLAGTLLGILCLRMKGIYLSLVTLSFAGIFLAVVNAEFDLTGGTEGLPIPLLFGTLDKLPYYFLGLGILVFTLVLKQVLERSRWGLKFLAVREDEYAAEIHGVDATREKVLAFAISTFIAAIAGAFLTGYIGRITPATMDLRLQFRIVVMSYVGGIASVPGAVIGAFLMRLVEEYARGFETASFIVWGFILLGVFFFMPNGLWGQMKEKLPKIWKILIGAKSE